VEENVVIDEKMIPFKVRHVHKKSEAELSASMYGCTLLPLALYDKKHNSR
jgi:hypothetical protein